MTRENCPGTTKKGQPCKATPRKDTGRCNAHSPRDVQESAGFGRAQPGAGRPPNPRAVDVLKERIEENIDLVLDPLWEALDADSGVVVGNGAHAAVEMVPDHRTRITAARELLDRGYGKAKQSTEITTPDGGGIVLIAPVDSTEKSTRAAELLAARGQVRAGA